MHQPPRNSHRNTLQTGLNRQFTPIDDLYSTCTIHKNLSLGNIQTYKRLMNLRIEIRTLSSTTHGVLSRLNYSFGGHFIN